MQFLVKFKGLDHSQALADHVTDRFDKLDKFEIKPVKVQVTFSHVKQICRAEVYVKGVKTVFRADASGENYNEAADKVMKKLERQMEKEKSKVKHHKNFERSNTGIIEMAAEHEELEREREERKSA